MTLSGGPCASRDGVTSVVADFEDVDEIKADGPARKGRRAVVGLAGRKDTLDTGGNRVLEKQRTSQGQRGR